MPLKQIGPRRPSPLADKLVSQLAAEWQNPQPGTALPVILEEHDSAGRLVHVYVVWDVWDAMEADERAEIVLDAGERVKGRQAMLDVTVAMGLSPVEADRMRIPYR